MIQFISTTMRLNLLKFVYRGILTGMPLVAYNPITKTTLHVPFTIKPQSTYVNYKLDQSQVNELNDYIHGYDPTMDIVNVKLLSNEMDRAPYLSVNIYNCSSPIFFNENNDITRLEVNTYVQKWNETSKTYDYGTLILDYTSNELSMDPIHLFKSKEDIRFKSEYSDNIHYNTSIHCMSAKDELDLHIDFMPWFHNEVMNKNISIHEDLIQYSDAIYYKNGIYDKLYYDSSLTNAPIEVPSMIMRSDFYYKGMIFDEPDHVFFFTRPIFFVGGMWDNVFSLLP